MPTLGELFRRADRKENTVPVDQECQETYNRMVNLFPNRGTKGLEYTSSSLAGVLSEESCLKGLLATEKFIAGDKLTVGIGSPGSSKIIYISRSGEIGRGLQIHFDNNFQLNRIDHLVDWTHYTLNPITSSPAVRQSTLSAFLRAIDLDLSKGRQDWRELLQKGRDKYLKGLDKKGLVGNEIAEIIDAIRNLSEEKDCLIFGAKERNREGGEIIIPLYTTLFINEKTAEDIEQELVNDSTDLDKYVRLLKNDTGMCIFDGRGFSVHLSTAFPDCRMERVISDNKKMGPVEKSFEGFMFGIDFQFQDENGDQLTLLAEERKNTSSPNPVLNNLLSS